jgi:hypothetical protein
MWTRYFMALLGALTAAVPIFIQAWKNGMATKEAKERVALLHGALAEKLGLPDTTPSVPVPPPKSLDKLDMILSRLEALEKRGQS